MRLPSTYERCGDDRTLNALAELACVIRVPALPRPIPKDRRLRGRTLTDRHRDHAILMAVAAIVTSSRRPPPRPIDDRSGDYVINS